MPGRSRYMASRPLANSAMTGPAAAVRVHAPTARPDPVPRSSDGHMRSGTPCSTRTVPCVNRESRFAASIARTWRSVGAIPRRSSRGPSRTNARRTKIASHCSSGPRAGCVGIRRRFVQAKPGEEAGAAVGPCGVTVRADELAFRELGQNPFPRKADEGADVAELQGAWQVVPLHRGGWVDASAVGAWPAGFQR